MDREEEFYDHIGGLAIIYGKDLSKESILVYYNAVKDLSLEDFKKSIVLWLNNPSNAFFPTPGQLKATLRPSDEQLAREAVARIVNALSRFGGVDNSEKAKEFIGELGWIVVQREGGWKEISGIEYSQLRTAQAQWREYAISILVQDRLGSLNKAPCLPSTEKKQLKPIGDVLQIPAKHQKLGGEK